MTYNAKYTIEEKIQMVTEQKDSGLTAKLWCAKNNVTYGSFKNFSQDIKHYNEVKNPRSKSSKQHQTSNSVTWISSPVAPLPDAENNNAKHPQNTMDSNVHYMIEIGIFKIHIPETIRAESLKTLVDVLSRCS